MSHRYDPAEIPASPNLAWERPLWDAGLRSVAGLDEAGRGAWAGPVCAGAVILPADESILARLAGVRDSKQMTPSARDFWAEEIQRAAAAWGVGFSASTEIDQMGIAPATRLAMQRALQALCIPPQHLLIDAVILHECRLPQTSLIKGDARSLSIAAASVLAKTARDARMVELDALYPQYAFVNHKGYGTSGHAAALKAAGPCPEHRFCYAPIKALRDCPAE
jgi:ribonuclease HII